MVGLVTNGLVCPLKTNHLLSLWLVNLPPQRTPAPGHDRKIEVLKIHEPYTIPVYIGVSDSSLFWDTKFPVSEAKTIRIIVKIPGNVDLIHKSLKKKSTWVLFRFHWATFTNFPGLCLVDLQGFFPMSPRKTIPTSSNRLDTTLPRSIMSSEPHQTPVVTFPWKHCNIIFPRTNQLQAWYWYNLYYSWFLTREVASKEHWCFESRRTTCIRLCCMFMEHNRRFGLFLFNIEAAKFQQCQTVPFV